MVGLGETDEEILDVMRDLRAHGVEMLTIGQYLAPSGHHLPVLRYVHPDVFAMFEREAQAMGFSHAACAPLVRSSYHADQQAHQAGRRRRCARIGRMMKPLTFSCARRPALRHGGPCHLASRP